MGFFMFGQGQVRDADVARQRALAGAAYLDRKLGPQWDRLIDLGRLDIFSARHCILAQLMQNEQLILIDPWRAIRYGFGCGVLRELFALVYVYSSRTARSYRLLTEAWTEVVLDRRRARVEAKKQAEADYCGKQEKTWKRIQSTSRVNRKRLQETAEPLLSHQAV